MSERPHTAQQSRIRVEQDLADRSGAAQVMGFSVRVAGRVPVRVDLRHSGTPERQLGLSLGMVLVYLRTHYTARLVEQAWSQAAPLARSLNPLLTRGRRGVMAAAPWSVAAMVRLGGAPRVIATLNEARPGAELPTMLRMQVGPITWDPVRRRRVHGDVERVAVGGESAGCAQPRPRMTDMGMTRPGRWGGRAESRDSAPMDWWVGVLRPGVENVDWTAGGAEPSWAVARDRAIAALRELAGGEGVRQEYRILVGDVPVMVWPGLHDDGTVDLTGLDGVLSLEADRA